LPSGPKSPSKVELVAEALRQEIASGTLPPGARLDQRGVAARFGLSATPVREALNQLAAEGILVHTPHQGMRVTDVSSHSAEEFEEIYLLRETLERLATTLAHEHVTRAQLRDLEKLHAAFVDAWERRDASGYRALNYSFHMRVYQVAAGPRTLKMIQTLWTLFPWDTLELVVAGDDDPAHMASVGEHERVLEALRSGTAEEAGDAMAEHIRHGRELLRRYMRTKGDFTEGER
jgi:DNA-binding GntR family transcriptional regulator